MNTDQSSPMDFSLICFEDAGPAVPVRGLHHIDSAPEQRSVATFAFEEQEAPECWEELAESTQEAEEKETSIEGTVRETSAKSESKPAKVVPASVKRAGRGEASSRNCAGANRALAASDAKWQSERKLKGKTAVKEVVNAPRKSAIVCNPKEEESVSTDKTKRKRRGGRGGKGRNRGKKEPDTGSSSTNPPKKNKQQEKVEATETPVEDIPVDPPTPFVLASYEMRDDSTDPRVIAKEFLGTFPEALDRMGSQDPYFEKVGRCFLLEYEVKSVRQAPPYLAAYLNAKAILAGLPTRVSPMTQDVLTKHPMEAWARCNRECELISRLNAEGVKKEDLWFVAPGNWWRMKSHLKAWVSEGRKIHISQSANLFPNDNSRYRQVQSLANKINEEISHDDASSLLPRVTYCTHLVRECTCVSSTRIVYMDNVAQYLNSADCEVLARHKTVYAAGIQYSKKENARGVSEYLNYSGVLQTAVTWHTNKGRVNVHVEEDDDLYEHVADWWETDNETNKGLYGWDCTTISGGLPGQGNVFCTFRKLDRKADDRTNATMRSLLLKGDMGRVLQVGSMVSKDAYSGGVADELESASEGLTNARLRIWWLGFKLDPINTLRNLGASRETFVGLALGLWICFVALVSLLYLVKNNMRSFIDVQVDLVRRVWFIAAWVGPAIFRAIEEAPIELLLIALSAAFIEELIRSYLGRRRLRTRLFTLGLIVLEMVANPLDSPLAWIKWPCHIIFGELSLLPALVLHLGVNISLALTGQAAYMMASPVALLTTILFAFFCWSALRIAQWIIKTSPKNPEFVDVEKGLQTRSATLISAMCSCEVTPEIRSKGAKVTTSFNPVCTSEGGTGVCIVGTGLECCVVTRFHTCANTLMHAICGRQCCVRKVEPPAKHVVREMWGVMTEDGVYSLARDYLIRQMTIHEIPDMFVGGKRAAYQGALDSGLWGTPRSVYNPIVKDNEKVIIICSDEPPNAKMELLAKSSSWNGNTPLFASGMDPRNVSSPPLETRLLTSKIGKQYLDFVKNVYDGFKTPILYAGGLSSEELSRRIWQGVEELIPGGWFATVSGDDVLVFVRLDDGCYWSSIDISRMDAHVSPEWLRLVGELLVSLDPNDDGAKWYVDMFVETPLSDATRKYRRNLGDKHLGFTLKASVDGTTASGDSITSASATDIAARVLLWAMERGGRMENGFPSLVWAYEQAGFEVESQWVQLQDWVHITYLQRRFVSAKDLDFPLLAPSLGRLAAKQFACLVPEVAPRRRAGWLKGVSEGAMVDSGHCPLARKLIAKNESFVHDATLWERNREKEEWKHKLHNMVRHDPAEESVYELMERYSLSWEELESMMEEIERARAGTLLVHDAWQRISNVDAGKTFAKSVWVDMGLPTFQGFRTLKEAEDEAERRLTALQPFEGDEDLTHIFGYFSPHTLAQAEPRSPGCSFMMESTEFDATAPDPMRPYPWA